MDPTSAAAPAPGDTLNVADETAVKRWAECLGVTPSQVEAAVRTAGPRWEDVKRHLLDAGESAGAG